MAAFEAESPPTCLPEYLSSYLCVCARRRLTVVHPIPFCSLRHLTSTGAYCGSSPGRQRPCSEGCLNMAHRPRVPALRASMSSPGGRGGGRPGPTCCLGVLISWATATCFADVLSSAVGVGSTAYHQQGPRGLVPAWRDSLKNKDARIADLSRPDQRRRSHAGHVAAEQ